MATCKLGTIDLDDNAIWTDEFNGWSPVVQQKEDALSGALIVQEATRASGRPITLTGLWLTRTILLQLQSLADTTDTTSTLTLPDGRTKTVFIDKSSGGVAATPIRAVSDPAASDLYNVTLNLTETTA